MKNKELIEILSKLDPEMDVVMYMHEDSDILSYVDVITPENEPYTKDDRCFEVYDNLTNPAIMLKTDW
jgi:hypothetical protein